MPDGSALDAVLGPLYAAVLEPERLGEFSAALCAVTGSQVGAVMAHHAQGGRLDLLVGADPVHMATYEREYAAENPWMLRGQHLMAPGVMVDSDAVLPRPELKRTRYYNEYLRLSDIQQSLALCAKADAEGVVVATLSRSGPGAFDDTEIALVRQVAPHWANAWAILHRLRTLERRVESLEAAMEVSPLAMFMLDGHGRVLRRNAATERLLVQGDVLRLEQGRPEAQGQPLGLRQLVHEAVAGVPVDGRMQRRAGKTLLKDAGGHGALVADIHPLGEAGLPGAAAVLFLQPVGAPTEHDQLRTLRLLFGLTPSEATLACALLRQGDLALAAAECGITPGTAQTRLKLVYDKTGVRGQVALIRLLAAVAAVAG